MHCRVITKGRKMGTVRDYSNRRPWTAEEEERLRELCEKYTKSDIARLMKRSKSSVNNKRRELGIEPLLETTDKWTFSQITEAVGVSKGVVNKTWVKHGLKFKKRAYFRLVEEKDLHKFMQEHFDLWDATKCDYYLFHQYPWFMEKLEKDKKQPLEQKQYYWTDYQKQQFEILSRRGYTHQQIADAIGKTKRAVDHYSSRLARKAMLLK